MNIDAIHIGTRYRQDPGDLRPLTNSIAEVGLLHPIVVDGDGRLVAGHRRIQAFQSLGLTQIPVTVMNLDQIARGELHENGVRQPLMPSEMVAVKRAIEPREREKARARRGSRTDLQLAANLAPSETRSFGDARDYVARFCGIGRTNLKLAEEVVAAGEREPEKYGELVKRMDLRGNIADTYRRLQVLMQAEQINAKPPAQPTGRFPVIVVDPAWPYDSSDLPYPTMSIEAIKALSVGDMAETSAILWLWTTNTHAPVAFEVVKSWGFDQKTMLTWAKDVVGTGQYLRGQTEHVILAMKGKPLFVKGKWSTLIFGERREHSRKPESFYELVEATCPGRKVELFARQKRVGWEVYGNDTNKFKSN
jgi:N6-adenosine-specific RNA methylase IME4